MGVMVLILLKWKGIDFSSKGSWINAQAEWVHASQKEINHKKPNQTCTWHELKAILKECSELLSWVAAGNNIPVVTDTWKNYPVRGRFQQSVCPELLSQPAGTPQHSLPQAVLQSSLWKSGKERKDQPLSWKTSVHFSFSWWRTLSAWSVDAKISRECVGWAA